MYNAELNISHFELNFQGAAIVDYTCHLTGCVKNNKLYAEMFVGGGDVQKCIDYAENALDYVETSTVNKIDNNRTTVKQI